MTVPARPLIPAVIEMRAMAAMTAAPAIVCVLAAVFGALDVGEVALGMAVAGRL